MDTWDKDTWRVAREHKLDAEEIQRRKAALGLTQHELATATEAAPDPAAFATLPAQVIAASPDPKGLQCAARQLLPRIAKGNYNETQALDRIHVGLLLRRAGLSLTSLLSVYGAYLALAVDALAKSHNAPITVAFCKTVLLDMGLVLHGYQASPEADGSNATALGHPMLATAYQQAADPIFITSAEGIIEYVNQALLDITGFSNTEILGRPMETLLAGCHDDAFYQRLWNTLRAGESFRNVFVNRRKGGSLYSEDKTLSPLRNKRGDITHFVSMGKDISDRIRAQQQLLHLAYYDPLTELPNRRLLINFLEQALKRARRHQRVVAVLQIDPDDFRYSNQHVDQATEDALLKLMAQRLVGSLRGNDVVGRLNGGGFTVVLEDIGANTHVSRVVNKVLRCLSGAIELESRQYFLTVSLGISLFPLDGQDTQTLLKQADIALQEAKSRGGNTYQYCSRDLDSDTLYQHNLTRLSQALEQTEFELHYHCLAGVRDLRVEAIEALLRWRHPDRGLLRPRSFLGPLKETGLIVPVGRWVLRQACAQAAEWLRAGHRFSTIVVNLADQQFRDPELLPLVRSILRESGLPPERLELEIPEAVLMKSMHLSIQTLHGLHNMGIKLALDDFGTSHASLPNLLRLPLDTLKIDHRFIRDIGTTPQNDALVGSAIAMAHELGFKTVAEGVETEQQLIFLRERGCDAFQGFHHSRPSDSSSLTILLQHHDTAPSLPLH